MGEAPTETRPASPERRKRAECIVRRVVCKGLWVVSYGMEIDAGESTKKADERVEKML